MAAITRIESVISASTVALLIACWFLVTNSGLVSASYLPSPQVMFATLATAIRSGYDSVPLGVHIGASVARAMSGLALGVLTGVPTGLLMGYFPRVNAALMPILSFIRPVPAIAFIPLVILYFGIGESAKVFVVWIPAFLYMVLSTSAGVRSVPESAILAGLNLGLRRWTLFTQVIIPSAMPFILTGFKTALALSWAVMVAAELIAAHSGLGFLVMDASVFYRIPYVYLGIAIIGFIGLMMELGVDVLERRMLHWVKQR